MIKFRILLMLISVSLFSIASANDEIPSGIWEGYKQVGSTYQALSLNIGEDGNGFYGFMSDIRKKFSICFPITKESIVFENGFFQQRNEKNGLEFIIILGPSIDNTMEVMHIMRYPAKSKSFSQALTLAPVNEDQNNDIILSSCDGLPK